jgi:biopolymer transport protein TolR
MAFALGDDDDDRVLADINVTPLVDVMLVLLIIFMVTAPLLHQGIEVALPKATAENLPRQNQDPMVVTVRKDGLVYVRSLPIHASQLEERLTAAVKAGIGPEDTVYLRADRSVEYGRVIQVLDLFHRAGIVKIGMVTEAPENRP